MTKPAVKVTGIQREKESNQELKRKIGSSERGPSAAPAGPENMMPEKTRSATANRALKPPLSLDTTFSHINAVSSPSPQPPFLLGQLTEEQYERLWTMTNAELREVLVNSGIDPCTSMMQLIPNSC
jgi:hypothetical protein